MFDIENNTKAREVRKSFMYMERDRNSKIKYDDTLLIKKTLEQSLYFLDAGIFDIVTEWFEEYFYIIDDYHFPVNMSFYRNINPSSLYLQNKYKLEPIKLIIDKLDIKNFMSGIGYEQLKELFIITEKQLSSYYNIDVQTIKQEIKQSSTRRVRKDISRWFPEINVIEKGYSLFELCKNSIFFQDKIMSLDIYANYNFINSKLTAIDRKDFIFDNGDKYKWIRNSSKRIELDCLDAIEKYLKNTIEHIEFKRQYTVKINERNCYRIDLYLPQFNIAIECDEPASHSGKVNKEYDKYRENIIVERLNCIFVRFNPFEKGFNPILIADNIYKIINNRDNILLSQHGDISLLDTDSYEELKRVIKLISNGRALSNGGLFEVKWIYENILNKSIPMYDFKRACIEEQVCYDRNNINPYYIGVDSRINIFKNI